MVCKRVGGLQEQVVDGETGFLIDPGNAEEAGRAIVALLDDPDLAASMGDAGHDRVAQQFVLPHDLPRWIEAIEYVYSGRAESQHA